MKLKIGFFLINHTACIVYVWALCQVLITLPTFFSHLTLSGWCSRPREDTVGWGTSPRCPCARRRSQFREARHENSISNYLLSIESLFRWRPFSNCVLLQLLNKPYGAVPSSPSPSATVATSTIRMGSANNKSTDDVRNRQILQQQWDWK